MDDDLRVALWGKAGLVSDPNNLNVVIYRIRQRLAAEGRPGLPPHQGDQPPPAGRVRRQLPTRDGLAGGGGAGMSLRALTVEGPAGRGGHGVVWKVRTAGHGVPLALKTLPGAGRGWGPAVHPRE